MKAELSILKAFLSYDTWNTYSPKLSASDFPDDLKLLYRTLDAFHKTNDEQTNLSLQDLLTLFMASRPANKEFYEALFETLEKNDVQENITVDYISSLRKARLLRELSIAAYEVAEGKVEEEKLDSLVAEWNEGATGLSNVDSDEFVTTNLEEILNETTSQPGFTWRLNALNRAIGSLRKGDFGFVFARPETGKTTFLASEVSCMLQQVGEGQGPIIWFNNEEQGNKVVLRVIQAFFGVTLEQLLSNVAGYSKAFEEQTGGKFKLYDSASIDRATVDRICKKEQPSLILFDQLDKIKGFTDDREDLRLGAIYRWARELAKQYGPVIGVSQADGTGENVRWLTMQHVANAKTSKQAEADWIAGIGKIHDTGYESMRFINISKNKLMGDSGVTDPALRHGHLEVLIKPEIARYADL